VLRLGVSVRFRATV